MRAEPEIKLENTGRDGDNIDLSLPITSTYLRKMRGVWPQHQGVSVVRKEIIIIHSLIIKQSWFYILILKCVFVRDTGGVRDTIAGINPYNHCYYSIIVFEFFLCQSHFT